MPSWTKEQELAINKSGQNIIVSAGAGSGKTAVLTERVIRKIKNGISIKNLLILTFTNNAAHEMKERIRDSIKQESINNELFKKELDYIDTAYITTFDAFSLSIVKKYHYLINCDNDISIIDSSIIDLKKEDIINDIFEDLYKSGNKNFLNLVNTFCIKDDSSLKNNITNMYNKIDLIINKNDFLNNYIDKYYSNDFINSIIKDYENIMLDKINSIKRLFNLLSYEIDGKYYEKFSNELSWLYNINSYNDLYNTSINKLSMLRNATDLGKDLKSNINQIIDELIILCKYDTNTLIEHYNSTRDNVSIIIDIIKLLDSKITLYKKSINKYEFNDISKLAIDIVKNNIDVRDELKNTFMEICIDEYQDTSDIQETFINLISNNNLYMVGDIKQSIYRFRNANPIIFKDKYDNYSNNNGGFKIDLVKNFRSRNEVLDDINNIFNLIMDNYIGGAEYSVSHNMVFGNNTYINEGKTNQNNSLEIYNYEYNKDNKYSKEEIEAFIIANDIKNKVNSKYKVFDKNKKILRDIEYNDFVILMDRSNSFDIYKKIFEYLDIPTTIFKDEDISKDIIVSLIKNIITIIIKIKNNIFDIDYKYALISILRSYLINYSDNDIFNIVKDKKLCSNIVYDKCLNIVNNIDNVSNVELLNNIVSEFDFYNKFIVVGDINKNIAILNYLSNIFNDLDSIGYNIDDVCKYLDSILSKDKAIKVDMSSNDGNTVKLMTIHKSKGLEFHVCYFSGYDKSFNVKELSNRIIFSNKYGIITQIDNGGLEDIITKYLFKYNYIIDDISERIRLLYVALTRCKEKMIIVGNFNSNREYLLEDNNVIDNRYRSSYKSFNDIVNSFKNILSKYFIDINLDNLNISHDYNIIKEYNIDKVINKTNDIVNVVENIVDKEEVINKHFSKENNVIIDNNIKNNMLFGTYIHELFECIDFINPDLSNIDIKYVDYIKRFLNNDIFKNISNSKIYKEYEFYYDSDNYLLHGIIDLMLEYNDYIDIIDYKLMNTSSVEYINQLNGYKGYIENSFNKKVNIYLYSIVNDEFSKLD